MKTRWVAVESVKNLVSSDQENILNACSSKNELVALTDKMSNIAKLFYEAFLDKQGSINSLSPLKSDIELIIHPDGTVESPWWTIETSKLLCAVCGMQGSAGCITCTSSQQWCG